MKLKISVLLNVVLLAFIGVCAVWRISSNVGDFYYARKVNFVVARSVLELERGNVALVKAALIEMRQAPGEDGLNAAVTKFTHGEK